VIVKDGSGVTGELAKGEHEEKEKKKKKKKRRKKADLFGRTASFAFVFFTIHERADLLQTVFTSVACNVSRKGGKGGQRTGIRCKRRVRRIGRIRREWPVRVRRRFVP